MKVNYKNGMPLLKMKVKGPKGETEYDAYLDTGAERTLIPEKDAKKFGLTYAGDTTVITGTGKDAIKLYRAHIDFLGKQFYILVFGRDILDRYKLCFDGIKKEIEVT